MTTTTNGGGDQAAPNYDHTSTKRSQRRREALNQLAQATGYETWRRLETAALNGEMIQLNGDNDEN